MPSYREIYKQGPFPHRIDPWAEAPRYFQQIHSGIINDILNQIQDTIFDMGYVAGKETSLLVTERHEPEIFPNPDAIHIIHRATKGLVTIIEIILPHDKEHSSEIWDYRNRLVYSKGINVVELDLTRSVKRLTQDILAETYAYHIAVYLFDQKPRFIGMDYGETLKRFALPLRHEVVGVNAQIAYDNAYQQAYIASHIDMDNHYAESELPFPSLLSEAQVRDAKETVIHWREELKNIKPILFR